jgi:molybdate transport system substrate-binding protein
MLLCTNGVLFTNTFFTNSLFTNPLFAQKLRIAAASDLQAALPELIRAFQSTRPNVSIDAVYGSSGNFVAQIRAGAPFDIFFSADTEYPQMLVNAGLGATEPQEYGRGRIVLWLKNSTPQKQLNPAQFLLQPIIRRIAIANPAHAPYGKGAKEYCTNLFTNAAERALVEKKFVLGDNAAQAVQLVFTGAAECGIIPVALTLSPQFKNQGTVQMLDSTLYSPLRQAALVLKASSQAALSTEFIRFVLSREGQAILKKYGLQMQE